MEKIKVMRFTAPWCGPCRTYKPVYEEVSKMDKYAEKFDFSVVDIEDDEDAAVKFNVRNIPLTVLVNESGTVLSRLTGMQTKDALMKELDKYATV